MPRALQLEVMHDSYQQSDWICWMAEACDSEQSIPQPSQHPSPPPGRVISANYRTSLSGLSLYVKPRISQSTRVGFLDDLLRMRCRLNSMESLLPRRK